MLSGNPLKKMPILSNKSWEVDDDDGDDLDSPHTCMLLTCVQCAHVTKKQKQCMRDFSRVHV